MRSTLLFLLLVFHTIALAQAQNDDPLFKREIVASDINDIIAIGEDTLLINDPINSESPFFSYDLVSNSIINTISNGRGPGEIGERYKTVTMLNDTIISIFDKQLFRNQLFNKELELIETIQYNGEIKNAMQAGPINDSTYLTVPFENVFEIYDADDAVITSKLKTIPYSEETATSALRNFLLKQYIHVRSDGEAMYCAFEYSSLILKVNRDGIVFHTLEPANYLLPYEEPEGGRIYSIPESNDYPVGALDIEVDSSYIYVLYSGKKITGNLFKRLFNIDVEIEKIEHTDKVHIYDKTDGTYLNTVQLPVSAMKFDLTDQHIYLVRTLGEPSVMLYKYARTF